MRVLVACEFSGVVRDALIAAGVDAVSCDLRPSERLGPHIHGDVLEALRRPWDLVIAHPPCTHIAVSGAAWFEQKRKDGRQKAAIDFFMEFTDLPWIPRVAIENPVCIMSKLWRKPDQIIQPYEFGHPESKKTCLWLKGLPHLVPTEICEPLYYQTKGMPLFGVPPEDYKDSSGKRYSATHYLTGRMQNARWLQRIWKMPPSPERERERSRTYQGIADAMAAQWSPLLRSA